MTSQMTDSIPDQREDLRAQALRRLEKKRDFHSHLLAFILVNAMLWVIWALVFAESGAWFPWPLIPMFGWGIGLTFHAWDVYGRLPFTDEQIQQEEERLLSR